MSLEGLGLSAEALKALKEFAQSSGIDYHDDEEDEEEDGKGATAKNILSAVRNHFDIKDKYDVFHLTWENQETKIELHLKGIKRELGQTLNSTGLTM